MFGKTKQRIEELNFEFIDLKAEVLQARMELQDLIKEVKSLRTGKKRKRKPPMTQKKGYTKVTEGESQGMYEMFKVGVPLVDIASHYGRSSGTVSTHIDKHIEKEASNEN